MNYLHRTLNTLIHKYIT